MSSTPASWRQSGLTWWPLFVVMIVLDQVTKWLIHTKFELHESIYVLPVLDILHARNPGVAFSMFDDGGSWPRWVFTGLAVVVSIVILVALRRLSTTQRLQCAGLMLIVSGALGNAIDRTRFGYVIDFVAVHWGKAYFPAFNVADSCISIGAGLILLDALLEWRHERRVARGEVR